MDKWGYENNNSPRYEIMKYLFFSILVSLIIFTCNFSPQVMPEKIIGKKYNFNSLPYGSNPIIYRKNINGVVSNLCCVYYKGKVLAYVHNRETIEGYFFSNFVLYSEIKKIPKGTSYEEILNKFGEPVGKMYNSDGKYSDVIKNSKDDLLYLMYLQKTGRGNNAQISYSTVQLLFSNEGKLIEVFEGKLM